jgi:hypothetical protein
MPETGRRRQRDPLDRNGDEGPHALARGNYPLNRLDIVVIRGVNRQALIQRQAQMRMRAYRGVTVQRIVAMNVGERSLREAEEQRNGGRYCRQSFQDSFQSMFLAPGWSTRMLSESARQ